MQKIDYQSVVPAPDFSGERHAGIICLLLTMSLIAAEVYSLDLGSYLFDQSNSLPFGVVIDRNDTHFRRECFVIGAAHALAALGAGGVVCKLIRAKTTRCDFALAVIAQSINVIAILWVYHVFQHDDFARLL